MLHVCCGQAVEQLRQVAEEQLVEERQQREGLTAELTEMSQRLEIAEAWGHEAVCELAAMQDALMGQTETLRVRRGLQVTSMMANHALPTSKGHTRTPRRLHEFNQTGSPSCRMFWCALVLRRCL